MTRLFRTCCACAATLALYACGFEHGELPPDAPAPTITVSFGTAPMDADEASGTVMIPVVLSEVSTTEVTVDYAVGSGTATRPDDFTLPDGTLRFMPGQTEQAISVAIAMDNVEESDETIIVSLAQPVGATLGPKSSHTLTISADILPRVSFSDTTASAGPEATSPSVTVVLTVPAKQAVTVELDVGGTAGAHDHAIADNQVVSFAVGETSKVVPLGVVQDLLDEDDETVMLTLANPSTGLLLASTGLARQHTITDDDPQPTVSYSATTSMTAESANIDLTVQLSAASGRVVTVNYAVTGGTASSADATVTGAPGTVTFMPGQTSRTIAVTVTNDAMDENNETLAVTLSNPVNATLGANTVNTLTITDDDNPPQVAFTQATASVNEAMTTVNLTVQLSAASAFDVTVPYTVGSLSTADNPEDYTIGTSVMIPAGMTMAAVAVAVKTDTLDEANETVIVNLGTPTNATVGTIASETLTINDDDAAPTVAFTSSGSMPNEGNNNITLTVQLSDISGQDVTVPFTIDAGSTAVNPADYTISPASPLLIPAGQTSTTIVIAMKEDTVDEVDETVIVNLDAPTNATLATPSTYTLTIRDDDSPPDVSWNPAESNLTEAEGTAPPGPATRTVTFTMVLTAASSLTVTVPIVYTGTASSPADYSGPTMVSFAPGETSVNVTLTIQKDATNEPGPAETIIMTIDGTGVMNAGTTAPLARTYSITDDD